VSLVYRAGAFFFYFGIASAVLSGLFIAVFLGLSASSGVPIPDLVVKTLIDEGVAHYHAVLASWRPATTA